MKPLSFKDIRVTIPPVTGVNGNNQPYANVFDSSRTFRDRAGSGVKRPRRDGQDELLNSVFDLTRDFPAPTFPDRPALDVASIKSTLVEAAAAAEAVKPLLDKEGVPDEYKILAQSNIALTKLVGILIEKGFEPLAAGGGGGAAGRSYASAARRATGAPPSTAPKPPFPGKKELLDALEKSERESVMFGANLGNVVIANRNTLNVNLTSDLQRRAVGKAADKPETVVQESLRLVEDALSCVDSLEFLGPRSKPVSNTRGVEDGSFCTMPVRLEFPDKDSRINFERTVRDHTGLRAVQSLPQSIRNEMAVFRKAMEDRYRDEIIMTRPNPSSLEFIAFRKRDGEKKWKACVETHPIPLGIMLPDFRVSSTVALPEVSAEAEDIGMDLRADGGPGGEAS